MEKVELPQVKIVAAVLVVVLSVQYATANHDIHQIPYSLGAKKTVCVPSINYTTCTHPGMKLNYHPPTSNNSVGTLLYNKLFMPDRVVARANTTEYGFSGVTSERNDSAFCVCFNEMSTLANGSKFSLDQICDISKLDREKTVNFEFFLVPSEAPSSSTPTTTTGNISTSSGPSEVSSAHNTPAATNGNTTTSAEDERRNQKISTAAKVGISIAVVTLFIIIIIVIVIVIYRKYKRRHSRQDRSMGSSSPDNNTAMYEFENN